MITPQEVREKSFEKAVVGGYVAAIVDSFLDEVSTDYAAVFKENAVLKSKMKVLVEKVEEYRSTEDAMRMALLSAQKMGTEITSEAKSGAEAIIAEAEAEANEILRKARQELARQEASLIEAKRSSAQFLEKMRLICTKQLDFLDAVGEMKIDFSTPGEAEMPEGESYEAPPADEELEDTVKSIENSVAKMIDDPEEPMEIETDSEGEDLTDDGSDDGQETKLYSIDREIDKNDYTPRPKFKFENLKFGENYDKEEK